MYATPSSARPTLRRERSLWNRVPEVTAWFWVIKVLATTVGETAANHLSRNLGLGLAVTTGVISTALVVALGVQFAHRRYAPVPFWTSMVLAGTVGTLVVDDLARHSGIGPGAGVGSCAVALVATFLAWRAAERTLSIRTVTTRRREAFYWLAVLVAFALGAAVGGLVERIDLGPAASTGAFGAAIAFVAFLRATLQLDHLLAFWLVFVLTGPLGASLGEWVARSEGLGLGTVVTSAAFLVIIIGCVAYLTVTRIDRSVGGRSVVDLP